MSEDIFGCFLGFLLLLLWLCRFQIPIGDSIRFSIGAFLAHTPETVFLARYCGSECLCFVTAKATSGLKAIDRVAGVAFEFGFLDKTSNSHLFVSFCYVS
jgi:hypothetical protein